MQPHGDNTNQTAPGGAATQDVVGQAQQVAGQATDQAQQKTGELADQLKQQASVHLSNQVDVAADRLGSVSQALQAVSGQLRQQDQPLLAEYAGRTAEQVQRAADHLRGKDITQVVDEAEQFARSNPAVFLAGAFGVGLLAARFLKSSGQGARAEAAGPPAVPALPSAAADGGPATV